MTKLLWVLQISLSLSSGSVLKLFEQCFLVLNLTLAADQCPHDSAKHCPSFYLHSSGVLHLGKWLSFLASL
jgi:hypothetical protein